MRKRRRLPHYFWKRQAWLKHQGYVDEAGRPSYGAYTHSSRWTRRRKAYFRNHPRCCWVCEAGGVHITLHHRTYAHIGAERDEELVPLCARCHDLAHWGKTPGGIGDASVYLRKLFVERGLTGIKERHRKLSEQRTQRIAGPRSGRSAGESTAQLRGRGVAGGSQSAAAFPKNARRHHKRQAVVRKPKTNKLRTFNLADLSPEEQQRYLR